MSAGIFNTREYIFHPPKEEKNGVYKGATDYRTLILRCILNELKNITV
jgi:hypothetical protein